MAKLTVNRFPCRAEMERHYLGEVDASAEASRSRVVTQGSGQAMTYEAKYQEARRYPGEGPHPFLEAEAEILGVGVQAVAEAVLAARERVDRTLVGIEAERLKAKRAIRAATCAADMHAIVGGFQRRVTANNMPHRPNVE